MKPTLNILLLFSIATILIWGSCKKRGDTTPVVDPDAVVAGTYRVSIDHVEAVPPGINPGPYGTTRFSTVQITVISPGVISFNEDSITNLQTTYAIDTADGRAYQSYIYGTFPFSYAQFNYAGDSLFCFNGMVTHWGRDGTTYTGIKVH